MTIAIIFAATCVATNAVAELGTVIVEDSRIPSPFLDSPAEASVLSREDLIRSQARDLPSAVTRVTGLNVMNLGAGNPALAQMTMRGYGETGFGRVRISVDGIREPMPDLQPPNLARIPFDGIERIEVLHGPQTVRYGDGASAGAVNVVTDSADKGPSRSYVSARGGSWGTFGAATGTRGRLEDDGLTFFADFGYDRSDGYREHSVYDLWNAQGGLRQDFANGAWLRLSTFFSDATYELPGPLDWQDAKNDPTKSTYRDWGRVTAYGTAFSGKGLLAESHEITFALSFIQRKSHFTNGNYTDIYGTGNRYSRDYQSNVQSLAFTPEYVCSENLAGFANELRVGGELRGDILFGDGRDDYPDYAIVSRETYDVGRLVFGGFAEDEFELTEGLSLTLGARLERDWNRNSVATDGGHADNFAAGESALAYRPDDTLKVFLRWCTFYRNPFMDEYRWRSGIRGTTTRPERGWDVELGGDWKPWDGWTATAIAFYSEVDNEIHYNPFAMSNENSQWLHRREGIDLSLGWEREKTASARIAWSGTHAEKAEGLYEGNWVPGVPRQQLALDGRVWLWGECSAFAGYRMIGTRYAISDTPNANGRLPVASIFRAGIEYAPETGALEGLTFGLVCENLFDQRYCDYAVASVTRGVNAYYPAAGRSFFFSIRYAF